MARLLIDKQVDIYEYPTELDDSSGSITIGDLHGNSLKLIHFLLRHRIIAFNDDVDAKAAYGDFVAVYEEIGAVANKIKKELTTVSIQSEAIGRITKQIALHHELSTNEKRTEDEEKKLASIDLKGFEDDKVDAEQKLKNAQEEVDTLKEKLKDLVQHFNDFMPQLKVINKDSLVRLIGDELADRGSNDYFTLRILGLLKNAGVHIHILLSNHSAEFITAYESLARQQGLIAPNNIHESQKMSFFGLKILMDEQIIAEEEVTQIVNDAYKPCLKALDYTLSDDGINLFSHAPITFEMIKHTAARFKVVYDDSSKEALAQTIDKINTKFAQIVQANRVNQWCESTDNELIEGMMTKQQMQAFPLINIIWNRWTDDKDTAKARPASYNSYKINYLHGHDSHQSKYDHVTNLDTSCGKYPRNSKLEQHYAKKNADGINKYIILNSDERGLEQKHSLELIEKEFMQHKQSMFNTARARKISGVAAGIGLLLGAAIGIALVATGVFAPLGLGVLGIAAMAATLGGGLSLVAGGVAFTVAKTSERSTVSAPIIEDAEPLIRNSSLSVMASGLGPATESTNRLEQEPKPQADVEVSTQSNHDNVAAEERSFSPQ